MRHKRDIVLQILEQEVGSIQRKVIHLGDMFLRPQQSPKKGRKLEKWVERNFNDSSLQELGRLTKTDIVKLPKNNVCIYVHRQWVQLTMQAAYFQRREQHEFGDFESN
jgi:hypothetical protein